MFVQSALESSRSRLGELESFKSLSDELSDTLSQMEGCLARGNEFLSKPDCAAEELCRTEYDLAEIDPSIVGKKLSKLEREPL